MKSKSDVYTYSVVKIDSSNCPFTVMYKPHGWFQDWRGFNTGDKTSTVKRFATVEEAKEYIQYRISLDDDMVRREKQEKLDKKRFPYMVWPKGEIR
jgi:hypothetical protein